MVEKEGMARLLLFMFSEFWDLGTELKKLWMSYGMFIVSTGTGCASSRVADTFHFPPDPENKN